MQSEIRNNLNEDKKTMLESLQWHKKTIRLFYFITPLMFIILILNIALKNILVSCLISIVWGFNIYTFIKIFRNKNYILHRIEDIEEIENSICVICKENNCETCSELS